MPAIEKPSCLCCVQSRGTFHQAVASEPSEESSDECEQNSEDDGESSELFTPAFAVKGSTYEESYQSNLKLLPKGMFIKRPLQPILTKRVQCLLLAIIAH